MSNNKATIETYTNKDKKGTLYVPSRINTDPVVAIGNSAFSQCAFSKIVLPSGIKKIDEAAFYECNNLYEVTILSGVTTIGVVAFMSCKMKSVKIPASVKSAFGEESTLIG